DWMRFLNDGYAEDWVKTLEALERFGFARVVPGHGDVVSKEQLTFFRGYLSELMAAVKGAAKEGASLVQMKKTLAERLAPKYEQRMSKHPDGQYRERVGSNIEMVYRKVVQKA